MNRSVLALLLGIVGASHLIAVEPPARVLQIVTGATPVSMAINPATGQLFSLGPVGHVSIIDEVTRQSSAIMVSSDALGLTVDSLANRVYITSSALSIGGWFGGLTVVDPSSGHTDFINASYLGLPTANSSTHRVYVTNPYYTYHNGGGFHSIGVFDGETFVRHGVAIAGSRSVALAVDETHDRIFVATMGDTFEPSDTVTIVDGSTGQSLDVKVGCPLNFPAASGTTNVAVDSEANRAWVTCSADPRMLMVDANSLAVSSYPLDGYPTVFAVNPATHKLYVALYGPASLLEIDPEFRVIREIPFSEPVTGLAANSQTDTIYASHAAAGTVTLVDGQSHETVDVEVGPGASSIVVDATRDIAWVATEAGLTGLYGPTSPCFRCPRVVRRPPR